MNAKFSVANRRAFFCARIMAAETGESEVTSACMLAALFTSPEVVNACERINVAVDSLITAFEVHDRVDALRRAENWLLEHHVAFGSHLHLGAVENTLTNNHSRPRYDRSCMSWTPSLRSLGRP
jgi:hypothetical protein